MAVRKRPDALHDFQQFMYYRGQKSTSTSEFTKFGNKLKKFLDANGTEQFDEDGNPGNIVYKFGRPVYIGKKAYAGFEKRRTDPQPVFDEDAAIALAEAKGIPLEEVTTEVTVTMSPGVFRKLEAFLESGSGAPIDLWDDTREIHRDVDQNAFYRLHQLGKISEEEIDSLLVLPEGAEPSYSFWPLEADAEDLEDE